MKDTQPFTHVADPCSGNGPAAEDSPAGIRFVERKTALRGCSIAPSRAKRSAVRRATENDLRQKDPEVPYHAAERANRTLLCAVLERQDRMNTAIFGRILDLEFRIEDLESDLAALKEKKGDTGTGVQQ